MGIHTWCQTLVSFHAGQYIAHVRSPSFGSAGGGARRMLFFWTQPNGPKLFSHNGMTMDIMHAILIDFRHSMHLLRFCQRKEPETLPGRDAMFVRCQEWLRCCMGAYIGHPHMVPNFGVISCRPAHSTCAITIIRVCRRGSPKDVVFLESTKWNFENRMKIVFKK